ncbi:MAG: SCO family protein [Pyrinomonadaceae bacterium]
MKRRELFTSLVENKSRYVPHPASPGARRFTNALLRTHEDKEVRFYDDLIRGRQVVVNFMYAECHGACPMVTATLIKVYQALKDRMGQDIFFYSISVKPEQDNPAMLKRYAETRSANLPGWTFLTGDPFDIETIRFRLFRMSHPGFDLDAAMHAGTLRIINDATNCWTAVEAFASMRTILEHISWADPPKSLSERLEENKALQAKIDGEVKLHGYRRAV